MGSIARPRRGQLSVGFRCPPTLLRFWRLTSPTKGLLRCPWRFMHILVSLQHLHRDPNPVMEEMGNEVVTPSNHVPRRILKDESTCGDLGITRGWSTPTPLRDTLGPRATGTGEGQGSLPPVPRSKSHVLSLTSSADTLPGRLGRRLARFGRSPRLPAASGVLRCSAGLPPGGSHGKDPHREKTRDLLPVLQALTARRPEAAGNGGGVPRDGVRGLPDARRDPSEWRRMRTPAPESGGGALVTLRLALRGLGYLIALGFLAAVSLFWSLVFAALGARAL